MKLYVAAFPKLESDMHWINDFRDQYDPKSKFVEPHFTIVFPTSTFSEKAFIDEVSKVVQGFYRFRVALRSALLMPEDVSGRRQAHIFLVPDEGFSHLLRLHDRLYSQGLRSDLKLDIPFIPHMTVGAGIELQHAKTLVDQLNTKEFQVEFDLKELWFVKIEDPNSKRKLLSSIPLG